MSRGHDRPGLAKLLCLEDYTTGPALSVAPSAVRKAGAG